MVVAYLLYKHGVMPVRPGDTLTSNRFSEWLYGDWDETKYQQYVALNSIPGVSNYMDFLLDYRASQEYLDRYGMDYTNIHDPRKLSVTGSASNLGRSAYTMVSKNIARLYR